MIYVFFFFQAEDGIRDDLVTGVQTCALPISITFRSDSRRAMGRRQGGPGGAGRPEILHDTLPPPGRRRRNAHQISAMPAAPIASIISIHRAHVASTVISCGSKT